VRGKSNPTILLGGGAWFWLAIVLVLYYTRYSSILDINCQGRVVSLLT